MPSNPQINYFDYFDALQQKGAARSGYSNVSNWWRDLSDESQENYRNQAGQAYEAALQDYYNEQAWLRDQQSIAAQNEYNSPKNQMARYVEAGLNPNVIYGQIGSGNQQSIAKFDPVSVNHMTYKNDKYSKLNKAMEVISTIGQIVSQGAQLAGQIEGVKNQSLQNQLLEVQLPGLANEAEWNRVYHSNKVMAWNKFLLPDETSPTGYKINPEFGTLVGDILFPEVVSGAQKRGAASLSYEKERYQKWWNDDIAPLYKKQIEGKSLSAEEKAAMDQYNRQMLETFPPALRPFVWLFTQMFSMLK